MWEGWKDVVAVVSNSFRSPFKCTLPLPGSPFTPTDTLKEAIVWRRVSPWYITRRLNALSVRHHHPRWPPTIHLTRNRYYRYTHHDIHNNCDVILYVPLQFPTLISPTPQNLLLLVHLDDGDQRRHFVPMVVEGLSLGTRRSMRRIMVLVRQLLLRFLLLMLLGTRCLFMVSQHLSTERRREIAPLYAQQKYKWVYAQLPWPRRWVVTPTSAVERAEAEKTTTENSKDYNIRNLKWSIKIRREIDEHIHSVPHPHTTTPKSKKHRQSFECTHNNRQT